MIVVVDDMITIGDFSSRCGLSPKADTVRLLRRAGVGLADIGQFLAEPTADALDGWERSLTAETLTRREALAEVRCRLGDGPERTRGAAAIEVRSVRELAEVRAAFDLAGAQLPEPIDRGDH